MSTPDSGSGAMKMLMFTVVLDSAEQAARRMGDLTKVAAVSAENLGKMGEIADECILNIEKAIQRYYHIAGKRTQFTPAPTGSDARPTGTEK